MKQPRPHWTSSVRQVVPSDRRLKYAALDGDANPDLESTIQGKIISLIIKIMIITHIIKHTNNDSTYSNNKMLHARNHKSEIPLENHKIK